MSLVVSTSFGASMILDESGSRVSNRGALRFKTRELNPITGLDEEWSRSDFVAYVPLDVSPITSHDVVVLGQARDGFIMLERWIYKIEKGAYYLDRELSASTPVGGALSTPAATVRIAGGTFISAALRPKASPRCESIYLGKDYSLVQSLAADPDGRFVWLLAARATDGVMVLERISILTGERCTLLDAIQMPFLLQADRIRLCKHQEVERLLFLDSSEPSPSATEAIVLLDTNNDGIIDDSSELTGFELQKHPAYSNPDEDFWSY